MSANTYWNLLVLFCVLCQGIIGTLSEKDIDESSELLVRQKRVINREPGGDIRERIKNFPYVVAVKRFRINDFCAGVILTMRTVLTVAKCVEFDVRGYRVYSGTSQVSSHGHPVVHNITDRRIIRGNHLFRKDDGIALITVTPPFIFNSMNTNNIHLYEGHIQPYTHGIVAGWGCNPTGHPGTAYPDRLRSITVPIITTDDCITFYLRNFAISDIDICTLDATGYRYCGVNDAGAPLVITVGNAHKLVGLHLWNGAVVGRANPDIFVNLTHPIYKTWIRENILDLEAHLNNPHNQQNLHHVHNVPHGVSNY